MSDPREGLCQEVGSARLRAGRRFQCLQTHISEGCSGRLARSWAEQSSCGAGGSRGRTSHAGPSVLKAFRPETEIPEERPSQALSKERPGLGSREGV